MEDQLILDLCWDLSENLLLLLSKDFSIVRANRASKEVFNCSENDLINKKIKVVFNEKLKQIFPDDISFSEKTQIMTRFLEGHEKFKIMWEVFPLFKNSPQKTSAFLIIGKTNDKLIEKNQETLQFEHLIKYAPGLFYWKDKESVYKGCNDEFAKLAGLTSRFDVDGKTDYDLPWKNRAELSRGVDKQVIDTGKSDLNREEIVRMADGKPMVMVTNKVPLFDKNHQVIGVLGITIDITEQKKAEDDLKIAIQKLKTANNTKTEFISNMSHDVKTPLSGIIALSEVLSTRVQEEYRDITQDISQAGQQLMIFFENCIELSKLENNTISLPEENFNLKHLLNEIFHLFQPAIKSKGLALYLEYDEKMPKRFLGNRASLYRVILNLVGNAVKFTNHGSITLSAKFTRKSIAGKKIIQLAVADTGIGIPKDKQKIIFERFSRLIPSYDGTYEGHGIGLYLVQKFVKKMGGQISVRSQEGKGSQFTLAIPLQIPLLPDNEYEYENEIDLSPKNSTHLNDKFSIAHKNSPEKAAKKIKILLVEDSLMAQKAAVMLLRSLGCDVDLAQCGKEAISLFKPGHYALIFMDIGLPDMKGYQVVKYLRDLEKKTSFHVPILGLSAHATEEEKQLSTTAGMDEMLYKPLLKENAERIMAQYVKKTLLLDGNNSNLLLIEDGLRVIDLQKMPSASSEKEQIDWEMLAILVESLPESRAEIEEAYQTHNFKLLLERVHKCYGGVCYTKTPHLLKAMHALEICLRNDENHHLDTLYNHALKSMEMLEKTYRSLTNDLMCKI